MNVYLSKCILDTPPPAVFIISSKEGKTVDQECVYTETEKLILVF